MKYLLLSVILIYYSLLLISCGGTSIPPQDINPNSPPSSSAASSSDWQNTDNSAVRITASGSYFSANAAPIFNEKFGGTAVEDQSCIAPNSPRITEILDQVRQKYVFSFNIKMDDIDCITNRTDRQRLEVKTHSRSTDNLKGKEDEIHFYSWDVFLPEGFQPSTFFTHLFQIKPVGENASMPLVTLTARKANENKLEVLYAATLDAQRIAEIPLSQLLGKWVTIRVTAQYANAGSLEISINQSLSNMQLLHYKFDGLNMWRAGTIFNRPKFGIYRSLNNRQDLREETLFFDNFCISEAVNSCW